jgi:hypothetical protein
MQSWSSAFGAGRNKKEANRNTGAALATGDIMITDDGNTTWQRRCEHTYIHKKNIKHDCNSTIAGLIFIAISRRF